MLPAYRPQCQACTPAPLSLLPGLPAFSSNPHTNGPIAISPHGSRPGTCPLPGLLDAPWRSATQVHYADVRASKRPSTHGDAHAVRFRLPFPPLPPILAPVCAGRWARTPGGSETATHLQAHPALLQNCDSRRCNLYLVHIRGPAVLICLSACCPHFHLL